jgi:hypothetical protein
MDLRQIASLLIFFIFYVIIGGTVFMYLEAPLENQKRQEIEELLTEFRGKYFYYLLTMYYTICLLYTTLLFTHL